MMEGDGGAGREEMEQDGRVRKKGRKGERR